MFKKIYWLYFILLGLFFIFVIPPFQKPDEYAHFNKSLLISYGHFDCNSKNFSYQKKYDLLRDNTHLNNIPFNSGGIMPVSLYKRSLFATPEEKQVIQGDAANCQMPTVSYLPQALSLLIVRPFGFNHFVDFFVGRLAMFIVSLCFLVFLFKKIKEPLILYPLLFMLALPMSIYQLTSYSYDAVHLLLVSIFFILIMQLKLNLIAGKKYWFFLLGVGCLLFLSRKGIEPLIILMPLLLISDGKKIRWKVLLIPLFFTVFFLVTNSSLLSFNTAKQALDIHTDSQAQRQIILKYPGYFLTVLTNTINEFQDFYIKSLIGKLGWLDYELPAWSYFFFAMVFGWLLYSLLPIDKKIGKKINYYDLVLMATVLVVNYLYLMILEYLSWTPVGNRVVLGIQGRYFLYLLPVLIWFLTFGCYKIISRYLFLILILAAVLIAIFRVTINRYYNYSIITEKQTPFELTKINKQLKLVNLDKQQFWQTELNFLPQRTLTAIEIYIRKPSKLRDQSYLYKLTDEKNRILRMGFFREHDLKNGEYQIQIKLLKLKKLHKLFLRIEPYGEFTNSDRLKFYQYKNRPLYSLIYSL